MAHWVSAGEHCSANERRADEARATARPGSSAASSRALGEEFSGHGQRGHHVRTVRHARRALRGGAGAHHRARRRVLQVRRVKQELRGERHRHPLTRSAPACACRVSRVRPGWAARSTFRIVREAESERPAGQGPQGRGRSARSATAPEQLGGGGGAGSPDQARRPQDQGDRHRRGWRAPAGHHQDGLRAPSRRPSDRNVDALRAPGRPRRGGVFAFRGTNRAG